MRGLKHSLYISLDGILEPLGESQILVYLEEMCSFDPQLRVHLLTFEKPTDLSEKERLAAMQMRVKSAGISWHFLRYHRRPRLLASAFDITLGILMAVRICLSSRVKIVHTRGFIPSIIGRGLQLLGVKWLFDMRGFWTDEKVDGGAWARDSLRYKILKSLERRMPLWANQNVTLSFASLDYLPKDKTVVIPTCVKQDRFRHTSSRTLSTFKIGYVGSASFSYDFDAALKAFQQIHLLRPEARFLFLNRDRTGSILTDITNAGLADVSEVRAVAYSEIPRELDQLNGALFFVKQTFSKVASCPTKLGELMSVGVPVLTNTRVGDVERLVRDHRVGVCIEDFNLESIKAGVAQFLELLEDPKVSERCRALAGDYFSSTKASQRYLQIYEQMLSRAER